MEPFSACVIIPVFNHSNHIEATVRCITELNLPCILVNDGSNQNCSSVLENLTRSFNIHLLTHEKNQGKGAAIFTALEFAKQQHYTHALQIDADGQHNLNDINRFLDAARQNPLALINGVPQYDDSVPKSRLYGRKISTFWVRINTLSTDIIDVLCGFRVYPVDQTLLVIHENSIGRRMEFDLEIIVYLYRASIRIINLETKVIYPADGSSNFDMWQDNVRISKAHTKHFFLMLGELLKRIFNR